MQIIRQPNGQAKPKPQPPRGRDIVDAAIRLRMYIATQLREQATAACLDAEHWSPSSVTALAIALEKQGVKGIPEECDGIAIP